jgi:UDP-N-acetylglucosamine 4,6-dehydratase
MKNKTILVTGGTGSFGQEFIKTALKTDLKKLIIFSRDELKQYEMQRKFKDERLRYFIGDIRDRDRLHRAFYGVDIIVHSAALKQIPTAEYNPFECIKTNILGSENIINEAIDCGVEKVIGLSTDKAVNPINLYGATKLVMEKMFVNANVYGRDKTKFSIVRYGNVICSRGSVIPIFQSGKFTITDENMTRFWMSIKQSVDLVNFAIEEMEGGEIFVPKLQSMKVIDLAKIVNPSFKPEITGIRPGEKLHEMLISNDELNFTGFYKGVYVISNNPKYGDAVGQGFIYQSDRNCMMDEDMKKLVENGTQTI